MLYAIIAAVAIALDQLFKHWIVTNVSYGTDRALLPGIVHLTNVKNTGAAFSLFSNSTILLTVVTIIFILCLIAYLIFAKLDVRCRVCLSAVIGGALGNLADRLRLGYVIDMFEVEFVHYAIFNIADCFIVVGVILFCLFYIFSELKSEKALKSKSGEKTDGD